jgi:UDPglucose--hexose-1-phosphate uridylyltransferase
MAKYVPDIMSRRWVILSENRTNRPNAEGNEKKVENPFKEGNEKLSGPEVFRIGEGEPDTKGWDVRVVPNKYPITDFHEVIIHSPSETKDLHELPLKHLEKVFQAYRQRFNFYKEKGQVLIFCNRGEHAGASIEHPHSQLVVIPSQINLDTLQREPLNNIVRENNFFNIYCPDFSQWPYEVWLAPKMQNTLFGDITDEQITDLAEIFQKVMIRLQELHHTRNKTKEGFSYNFFIHPKENWYMRIIPRFVYRAGFELGTGLSVNVTDPKDAARELRGKEEEIDRLVSKLKELREK